MNLPAEKTDHAESYSQEGDPNMQGARILLVEDDEVLRELMERNLRVRHHTVSIAVDAKSALQQLRTSTFDLIILDINLPDLSGWDVLRIARRELQYPPTDRGNEKSLTSPPVSSDVGNYNMRTWAEEDPASTDMQEEKLPIVVVSAVRVSPRRLSEFRPRAYLPKPFPMEALLRLAVEAAERKGGVDQSVPDQEDTATNDMLSSPSREEDYD